MPATGFKTVGTGACLPWCSISSSFQNSLKTSGHWGYEFLEFWCWNLVPFLPDIGFQLMKSLWSSLTYFSFNDGWEQITLQLCVPPCKCYIIAGDTHSLCVVCLGAKHAESALEGESSRIPSVSRCMHFAPGRLSLPRDPSLAFPAVLVPLPPRRSIGCTRGVRRWIWQREWRRASPYLLPHPPDPAAALWDQKPALRFLPPGKAARCSDCLPPRRSTWWASMRICPLIRPSMRSCWRW